MKEYGNQFKLDETITNIVFLRAMLGAVDGVWSITDREDDKVISDCGPGLAERKGRSPRLLSLVN